MNNSDWIVFVQIQYCLALPPVGRDVHLAPGTGPGVLGPPAQVQGLIEKK